MKVILVDDEEPARIRLRRMLTEFPDVEILAEAENGLQALEQIEKHQPDAVFLDIDMPALDGISAAASLRENGPSFKRPLIIFVTAYSDHAIKAFELSAFDYIVKPVAAERLQATMEKLRKLLSPAAPAAAPDFADLLARLTPDLGQQRMAIRSNNKYIIFNIAEVSAVIAKDHYSALIVEGREILSDDPLDILGKRLPAKQFLRVHRSAIINLQFLKELEREGDRKFTAVLNDPPHTRVPVSRDRLDELKKIFGVD